MAGKRFERSPSPQAVSWLLDLRNMGQLNLDPPYQRRSVWSPSYRRYFIDSILRNYPTQSIFIDRVVEPRKTTEYRVLDGKQRLTTVFSYIDGDFPSPDTLADIGLDGKYFDELDMESQLQILEYLFTVEIITNTSTAELNQAFDRLNRNVARLNRQELRHAQYDGAFIRKVEELASDAIWQEVGLVTDARRRRMLDVEYVSEFYVTASRGIQDGKEYLDTIYASWDDEIPDERAANKAFADAVRYISELNDIYPLANTRYSNVADFYSLWAAIVGMKSAGRRPAPDVVAQALADFAGEIERGATERAQKYILSARQGSNKASNRTTRADTLTEVVGQAS